MFLPLFYDFISNWERSKKVCAESWTYSATVPRFTTFTWRLLPSPGPRENCLTLLMVSDGWQKVSKLLPKQSTIKGKSSVHLCMCLFLTGPYSLKILPARSMASSKPWKNLSLGNSRWPILNNAQHGLRQADPPWLHLIEYVSTMIHIDPENLRMLGNLHQKSGPLKQCILRSSCSVRTWSCISTTSNTRLWPLEGIAKQSKYISTHMNIRASARLNNCEFSKRFVFLQELCFLSKHCGSGLQCTLQSRAASSILASQTLSPLCPEFDIPRNSPHRLSASVHLEAM